MAPVPTTHVAAPGRDRLGRESEDSMLPAMILLAQLHCSPSASGTVDCFDAQKGGAPVLKVEPNLFGGYDLRQSDGKLVRCEKTASGETECRVVQEDGSK